MNIACKFISMVFNSVISWGIYIPMAYIIAERINIFFTYILTFFLLTNSVKLRKTFDLQNSKLIVKFLPDQNINILFTLVKKIFNENAYIEDRPSQIILDICNYFQINSTVTNKHLSVKIACTLECTSYRQNNKHRKLKIFNALLHRNYGIGWVLMLTR